MKKVLYIIEDAPYSNSKGQEALDSILVGASFEFNISVLFLHNAVFQIKAEQNISNANKEKSLKQYTKAFAALSDFDIEHIYADERALLTHGLSSEDMIVKVDVINAQQIAKLIAKQDRVFTF